MNPSLPLIVVVWACVITFIVTIVATFGGLFGLIRLGGGTQDDHRYYLRRLFGLLIVEVIAISIGIYSAYGFFARKEIEGLAALIPERPISIPTQASPEPRIERQTLQAIVYATTDGNPNPPPARIPIPAGWRYVDSSARETTGNGSRSPVNPKGEVERNAAGAVIAVVARAQVGPRALFGPNNWQGIELNVVFERTIP